MLDLIHDDEFIITEDEVADNNGLPICKLCNCHRYVILGEEDGERVIKRCLCKCQAEAERELERIKKENENLEYFKSKQRLSNIGEKYLNASFGKAIITKNNGKAYTFAKNYVEKIEQMKSNNIGVYIFGSNSTGKSYLIACMCNELIKKGTSCIYTTMPSILSEIQKSFKSEAGLSQCEIISLIKAKQIVFIDDVGKEFVGGVTPFSEKVLLDVINSRYNEGKPVIFTSNYSIEDLSRLNLDPAIMERINEMSTIVIDLKGDDFRQRELEDKQAIVKRLGVI